MEYLYSIIFMVNEIVINYEKVIKISELIEQRKNNAIIMVQ